MGRKQRSGLLYGLGGFFLCAVATLVGPTGLAAQEELWCEGVDDDGDGEVDEGCDRSCVEPYPHSAPVLIEGLASATSSVWAVRPGTGIALAYADSRSGVSQVYVRVVATSGGPADKAEVRISDGVHAAYRPALAWKGGRTGVNPPVESSYGIVWVDERTGNPEIFFRELGADGSPTPTTTDVQVSASNGSSLDPVVVWTGTEFGVVWQDVKGTNRDIYFRRLDPFGSPLGQIQRVTTHSALQEQPALAWDGLEYALCWTDERDGDREIYARRLDAAGSPVGGEVRITAASGASERCSIRALRRADFGIAWQDRRGGSEAIWYGRWQGPGYAAPAGVQVSAGPAASRSPSLTTTGAEMLVAWEDLRDGTGDIYLRRLRADGSALSSEVRLTTGAGGSAASAVWHGSGVVVAFVGGGGAEPSRPWLVLAGCGGSDPDGDGFGPAAGDCNDASASQNPLASEACDGLDNDCDGVMDETCRGTCKANLPIGPYEIFASPDGGDAVVIAWDGSGYGVAWQERETVPGCCFIDAIYFRKLDADGNPVSPAVRLTPAGMGGEYASIVWTGSEFGVVWQQYPTDTFRRRIAFVRVDASGNPVGAAREVSGDPPLFAAWQTDAVLVWRQREYAIVFSEWGEISPVRIRFLRLDRQGRPIERPRVVSPEVGDDWGYIAADAAGYALGYMSGYTDVFFRLLDEFGGFRGETVQLSNDFLTQRKPRIETIPSGYGYWYDDETFAGDIYYRRLDSSGNPMGPPVRLTPRELGSVLGQGRLTWIGKEFLFVYTTSYNEVYMTHVDENGNFLGPFVRIDNNPEPNPPPAGVPEMAWNGIRPAVVWPDSRALGTGFPRPQIGFQTCCEDVPVPPLVSGLVWADRAALSWTDNGSERYDRIRGDLGTLRVLSGDWTWTVLDCKNDITATTSAEDPGSSLDPTKYYYLVRGDSICWAGSYDDGSASQQGSRDGGINASENACP